jgi:ankyrin repeat protein
LSSVSTFLLISSCSNHDDITGGGNPLLRPEVSTNAGSEMSELLEQVGSQDVAGVASLLKAGAKPDVSGDPRSPLVQAITSRQQDKIFCSREIVKLLLDYGADPNRPDPRIGALPLHTALEVGDRECAQMIRLAGGQIETLDDRGFSTLSAATLGGSRAGTPELIDLVISWGVNPNTRDRDGATSLHHAVRVKSAEMVAWLLARGVDPCLRNGIGQTPLEMAKNLERSSVLVSALHTLPCKAN